MKHERMATLRIELDVVTIEVGTEISIVTENPPRRVKAAAIALKKGMPPAARRGGKTARRMREEI